MGLSLTPPSCAVLCVSSSRQVCRPLEAALGHWGGGDGGGGANNQKAGGTSDLHIRLQQATRSSGKFEARQSSASSSSSSPSCLVRTSRAIAGQEEASGPAAMAEVWSEGLVFGNGETGSWDSNRVGSPIVRRYVSDNEERWCMWYSGNTQEETGSSSCSSSIGLATSSNGMHWRRGTGKVETDEQDEKGSVGIVMECSSNWWAFDTTQLIPSDVLIMSSAKVRAATGVYWLYYSGADAEIFELPAGVVPAILAEERVIKGRMRPGLAMSNDGRNWARIEGEHHSGALFDVGTEGEWDSLFIAAPQVVFHEAGDIRMYYHALDPNTGLYSVGFARSRDGMRWLKFGKILEGGVQGAFDELGIRARHVVEHPSGDGYLMVYEGVAADGHTSIGLARSETGLLKWERCQSEPILEPSEAKTAWDSKGVGSPCLVHMGGDEWRLYYVGIGSNGCTAIGMATNVGDSLTRFNRWHSFHL